MQLTEWAKIYMHFAWDFRKFIKTSFTLEQSKAIITERLRNREQNLLMMVKRTIYDNKHSPYLKLLNLAGCEYGDIENMIRSDGIEPTLEKLYRKGVYLSVEEFKGKKEIIRRGRSFQFDERDFDNPLINPHLAGKSGGSRSAGIRTGYDLNYLGLGRAVYTMCLLDALDTLNTPHILWAPVTPGFGPLELLACAKMGKTPAKWFSPVSSKAFKPPLINRIATNYIVHIGNLFGAKLPSPEYVPLHEAWIIARWIASAIKNKGGCTIDSYISNAVRICKAAREEDLNLTGAIFLPSAEPLTKTKRQEIESTGAQVCTRYIFAEGGYVGFGCLQPSVPDDIHFLKDSLALIQHKREVHHAGVSVNAFLFTSLLPQLPKVLLNVENGDYGVIEKRNCGCELEKLGFTEHISHIRGFDKLTGEGMTFVGTDLIRIIEEILPVRFGGCLTDFQLEEEEDENGQTHVNVLVTPELGPIDEDALIRTVLAELRRGHAGNRLMAQVWTDAGTLRVRREKPYLTTSGKLLPLHIQKNTSSDQ